MRLLSATDLAVPIIGALIAAALLLAGKIDMATGATAGAIIATASFIAMHHLGRRLLGAGSRSQLVLALILGLKLMATATLVFVAVHVLGFDGIGMAAGLSSMPAGIIAMFVIAGPGRAPEGDSDGTRPATEVKGDA